MSARCEKCGLRKDLLVNGNCGWEFCRYLRDLPLKKLQQAARAGGVKEHPSWWARLKEWWAAR